MNEFRRRSPRGRSASNVDGMLRPRLKKSDSPVSASRSTYRPIKPQRLDDFNRREGFFARPQRQNFPDGRTVGRNPHYRNDNNERDAEFMSVPPAGRGKKVAAKKKKSPKDWKKIFKRSAAGLMVLLLLTGGYLGFKGYLRARQVFKGGGSSAVLDGEVDPNSLKGEGDGRVNILLLGKGGPGETAADLTDTLLIASIDPINKEAGLLSLPRDFYVKMPGTSSSMKINAIYSTAKQNALANDKSESEAEAAGIKKTEEAVTEITGLNIHYHSMVDFAAFEEAINTIGGVDVNVGKPVYEVMRLKGKRYVLDVKQGQQHLDGLRALAYVRSRYTSARGDFDRSERQREVIIALKNKILSAGTYSNPVKISQLIDDFGTRVRTNIGIDEIGKLYNIGKEIPSDKIASIGLADPPNDFVRTSNMGGQSVVVPKAGTYAYSEIRSYVRNTLKDGFIKKENPSIVVLNGTTTSGLATTKSDELKSYGYNVIKVDDAPTKDFSSSILVDLRDGTKKYTKRYLELRFKTSATSKLPDGITPPPEADFVIIVGRNETTSR